MATAEVDDGDFKKKCVCVWWGGGSDLMSPGSKWKEVGLGDPDAPHPEVSTRCNRPTG